MDRYFISYFNTTHLSLYQDTDLTNGPVINNAGQGAGRHLEGPPKSLGCEGGTTKHLKSEKGGNKTTKLI